MPIDFSGATTTALQPLADAVAWLGGGEAAWGWALVLGGLGLRALQLPLLVRVSQDRVQRASAGPEAAKGRHPGLAAAVTITQLVLIVAVFFWTRDGASPAATEGFYGIGTLAGRSVTSGWGGWLLALAVVGITLLAQRQASPSSMDDRQRWFLTRVAPVILFAVAAILPPAVLLFWLSSTAAVVVVQAAVVRTSAARRTGDEIAAP